MFDLVKISLGDRCERLGERCVYVCVDAVCLSIGLVCVCVGGGEGRNYGTKVMKKQRDTFGLG